MTWAELRREMKGCKRGLHDALSMERLGWPPPNAGVLWDDREAAFSWKDDTGVTARVSTEQRLFAFCERDWSQDQR